MTEIYASRLNYRRIQHSDWPFFLALNQDPQVMHFINEPLAEDEIRAHYFEPRLQEWYKGCTHWLCFVITEKETGNPIGLTGFIERSNGVAEVGFILSPAFHGKGYGSESLNDIAQVAFNTYGYHKLAATVTSGNEASRKTLLKVGFQQEGTLRKNYYLHGSWQDDWLFGLLKEEYCAQ